MRITFISLPMILLILGAVYYVFHSIRCLFRLGRYSRKGLRTKGRLTDPTFVMKNNEPRLQMTYIIDGSSVQGESDELINYTVNDVKEQFSADQEIDIVADPDNNAVFIPKEEIKKQRKGYLTMIPVCIAVAAVLLYIIIFGIKIPFIDKIRELTGAY
ncbi:MAG: hypothetical protein IJ071_07580 [Ruminococcus sp.]|nr:hypothetical protein [Ruminococcus sp.]